MHQQLVIVLLVGLAVSVYGLDLSHAAERSTEESRAILGFMNDLYAQVIYPPLNHVVTSMALLGAQVLAGIHENGLPGPKGRTFDPSEAQLRGFFDDLWNQGVKPPIEDALSGLALMLAQALAGVGVNGVSLGKRDLTEAEMRGFTDAFADALNQVYTNVLQKPLENALSSGALMLAQVLAGMGANGVDLSSIFSSMGKRDLTDAAARQAELRGIFDSFADNLVNALQTVWSNVLQGPIEGALQSSALMAAQVLAGMGVNGISLGKRDLTADARGPIFDNLIDHATGLYHDQVKPMIEGTLNAAVLHLAGLLANFSQGNIGRR